MTTFKLVFTRGKGMDVSAFAVILLSTEAATQEEALLALQRTVTRWVTISSDGKKALEYSGGELNIGDLACYIGNSNDLDAELKKANVKIDVLSVNEGVLSEVGETLDYDLIIPLNTSGYPTRCNHCQADLTVEDSVVRVYINKDGNNSGSDDISCLGHYDGDDFEPDESISLSDGRFDCGDDSDKCASCNEPL